MVSIRKAIINDIPNIISIGKKTFLETYLINTPREAVEAFIEKTFDESTLTNEFANDSIVYHLVHLDDKLVGYSKIVLNVSNNHIDQKHITKLDRFYVLKEFHGRRLGKQLFDFIVNFSQQQQQQGIWLYVLIENERAVHFYIKNDFEIVGYHDFVVSKTRTNPNHVMFLEY
ncbi:GNAT family N-acetyltransferase [uncultured Kordia sp.]|uniref:GNAT family N-acetyltransferase n=1 Tax=uncultured Kordia sp. TaxID=507699 RepID=UPI002622CC78|nr:GNAT family N-acetyltransferase [uncultured Kordia sp.]